MGAASVAATAAATSKSNRATFKRGGVPGRAPLLFFLHQRRGPAHNARVTATTEEPRGPATSTKRARAAAAITVAGSLAIACVAGRTGTADLKDAHVAAVSFLPEMNGEPQARAQVLFQDGALSTAVPGGALWTFGDTFTGSRDEAGKPRFTGCLSNTMAFLAEGEKGWPPRLVYLAGSEGLAASPLRLADGEDDKKRRLWPLAGVWLPERGGGTAYMFYGLIDVTGPGPWGFKGVGTGLARAERAFGAYERLGGGAGGWPMDPTSIVRRDGYLYLYAPRRFEGEKVLSSGLLVGRVREEEIENPSKYEFLGAPSIRGEPRWTSRIEDARPARQDVWGQASVAWNEYLKAYVLATSSNFGHPRRIQLDVSETPWGPWRPLAGQRWETRGNREAAGVLADCSIVVPEREGEKTQLIYCTMLHPELDEDGGRVITLSFCRMLTREWALTSPEAVRVELSR